MRTETINKIVLNSSNELFLLLDSNGESMYQYIYREAAGVYWDEKHKGFKSTELKEWTVSDWYFHIRDIVRSSLNIDLVLNEKTKWESIPEAEQTKIKNAL
ncbi:MAG: hypothetical protein PHF49_04605 [Patescibacteria group bacterium]|nr:hypothetical protein [Patescibacteria group bacterium]